MYSNIASIDVGIDVGETCPACHPRDAARLCSADPRRALDDRAAQQPRSTGLLLDRYTLHETSILQHRCLLLTPLETLEGTPRTIAKHLGVVRRAVSDALLIVVVDPISPHNRQRLIAQHVAFIIPGNQMFVPDLAIDLREHFHKDRQMAGPSLSPTAQLLVLAAVQKRLADTTPSALANRFHYSVMSMSRAIDELEAARLVSTEVRGKFRHVCFDLEGTDLWHHALGLLRSPVRKRRTVRWSAAVAELPLAGESALAEWTDLAAPVVAVHAIAAAAWPTFERLYGIEGGPSWSEPHIAIETWSYDPLGIGDPRLVDPLSLWLSLGDSKDDRVLLAKDQLLKKAGL